MEHQKLSLCLFIISNTHDLWIGLYYTNFSINVNIYCMSTSVYFLVPALIIFILSVMIFSTKGSRLSAWTLWISSIVAVSAISYDCPLFG